MTIMDKPIVLKLNRSWQPVGFATVGKSVTDLCADTACFALDIDYTIVDGQPDFDKPASLIPVDWDRWITLPIRSWDLVIHTPNIEVRVPTVLIARNYDRMPLRQFRGNPSLEQIWERDNGVDQYTGKVLDFSEASVDHVLPVSKGGGHSWNNKVLTHKQINYKKGNKLNEEAGLKLLRTPTIPKAVPMMSVIRTPKHVDWKHFLVSSLK